MSVLKDKLFPVLFSHLRPDTPKQIREACAKLFLAVDSDLDVASFYPSSTTEEEMERFDAVLESGEASLPSDFDLTLKDEDEDEPIEHNDALNIELDEDITDDIEANPKQMVDPLSIDVDEELENEVE